TKSRATVSLIKSSVSPRCLRCVDLVADIYIKLMSNTSSACYKVF
ncbi:jg22784, partial [Pararge aegeria aegeria]